MVATVRSSASNTPVHDVTVVTVATDPAAAARDGDADVLPVVRNLRLHVVVANVGNERERRVPVMATLTGPTGEDSARQWVDLAPGQRRAVQLGGLAPVANQRLTLTVRVGPTAGETKVSDNEATRAIVLR